MARTRSSNRSRGSRKQGATKATKGSAKGSKNPREQKATKASKKSAKGKKERIPLSEKGFQEARFKRLVFEILQDLAREKNADFDRFSISGSAMEVLHKSAEQYIVTMFENANMAAINDRGRKQKDSDTTVMVKHIRSVCPESRHFDDGWRLNMLASTWGNQIKEIKTLTVFDERGRGMFTVDTKNAVDGKVPTIGYIKAIAETRADVIKAKGKKGRIRVRLPVFFDRADPEDEDKYFGFTNDYKDPEMYRYDEMVDDDFVLTSVDGHYIVDVVESERAKGRRRQGR